MCVYASAGGKSFLMDYHLKEPFVPWDLFDLDAEINLDAEVCFNMMISQWTTTKTVPGFWGIFITFVLLLCNHDYAVSFTRAVITVRVCKWDDDTEKNTNSQSEFLQSQQLAPVCNFQGVCLCERTGTLSLLLMILLPTQVGWLISSSGSSSRTEFCFVFF